MFRCRFREFLVSVPTYSLNVPTCRFFARPRKFSNRAGVTWSGWWGGAAAAPHRALNPSSSPHFFVALSATWPSASCQGASGEGGEATQQQTGQAAICSSLRFAQLCRLLSSFTAPRSQGSSSIFLYLLDGAQPSIKLLLIRQPALLRLPRRGSIGT